MGRGDNQTNQPAVLRRDERSHWDWKKWVAVSSWPKGVPMPSSKQAWELLSDPSHSEEFLQTVEQQINKSGREWLKKGLLASLSSKHSENRAKQLFKQRAGVSANKATIKAARQNRLQKKEYNHRFVKLVSGRTSEILFRELFADSLQRVGVELEECTEERNNLDFELSADGASLPGVNIKTAATQFANAKQQVGLEPEDTLPVAMYKAFSNDQQRLYVFHHDWELSEKLWPSYWNGLSEKEQCIFQLFANTEKVGRELEDAFIKMTLEDRIEQIRPQIGYQKDEAHERFVAISSAKCQQIAFTNLQRSPAVFQKEKFKGDVNVHVSASQDCTPFVQIIDQHLQTPQKREQYRQAFKGVQTIELPAAPV